MVLIPDRLSGFPLRKDPLEHLQQYSKLDVALIHSLMVDAQQHVNPYGWVYL